MTCGICKYEWCWVCGMPYKSLIHYGQVGGLVCEFISKVHFANDGCFLQFIKLFLLWLAMPLIYAFGSLVVGFFGGGTCMYECYKSYRRCMDMRYAKLHKYKGLKKAMCLAFNVLMFILDALITLVVVALGLAFGAIFATLFFAIFIVPIMVIYPIICCKKNSEWRQSQPKKQTSQSLQQQ